ncbi:MAG: bacterial regulatory s, tetR family protein [Verrucomicrobiaceae bacterium]|nr:bacterial regulatory s, tetR family protein [Verrucomicrobiaceae bacterium]
MNKQQQNATAQLAKINAGVVNSSRTKLNSSSQPKEWRRETSPSLLRILDGALAAISRHGASMLSMTDIAAAAGVSRATLYRYFSQKEDLLVALGEHTSNNFISGVQRAAAEQQVPMKLLQAVVEFVVQFTAQTKTDRQLEVEPLFVLSFLRSHFDEHVAAVTLVLVPFYEDLEARLGFTVDRRALSETLLRFAESTSLVPGGTLWHSLPSILPAAVEFLLSHAPRQRKMAEVEYAQ